MKGIILAGGSGTRLYPITMTTSKQLLAVYDKPMIYYPLSVLMQAEIDEILLISTTRDLPKFQELLKDGSDFGIHLTYAKQPSPDGLAQAFIIGKDFIADDTCAMILGDNIFHGAHLKEHLLEAKANAKKELATIFGYHVHDPERFGIVEFDEDTKKVLSVEEKPKHPKSHFAITGLYFYDNSVIEKALTLKPSPRNELEITDLNQLYLNEGKLKLTTLKEGYGWFDTGTHDSMLEAANYVSMMQKHQNLTICCPEEIAYLNGWLTDEQLLAKAQQMKNSSYGTHLASVVKTKVKK